MLDLFSIVPYYTGHLCAKLLEVNGLHVTLASITYRHDPGYFTRQGLENDPGCMDIMHRLSSVPAGVRRVLKTGEYLLNMTVLLARFSIARPDLVHVQFLPLTGLGLPLERWWLRAAKALGIGLVYTVHNLLPHDSGQRYLKSYQRLYWLADRLICHDTEAASRLASQFDIEPERISVIPHGPLFEEIHSRTPDALRRRLGIRVGGCLVLWQGILRPYKGVLFLLRAWQAICGVNPYSRLAIVGTGEPSLIEAVERDVRELGIRDRVHLELRFISVAELADFYDAADVVVYPYSEVTTSGALMTGIARGKAVIATPLPAFQTMLRDGDNALLVQYGDVSALATALQVLMQDQPLRRRLGEHLAASVIPQWREIAERTAECYDAALAAQAGRVPSAGACRSKP